MSCNTSLIHRVMQVWSLLTICVVHWSFPVRLTNIWLVLLVWLACWLGVQVCCFHNLKDYIEMEMAALSIFCASRFYFQGVLTCSPELRCIKNAHNIWSLCHSFLSPYIFIHLYVICATNWLLRYILNCISDSSILIILPLTPTFSGSRNYREKKWDRIIACIMVYHDKFWYLVKKLWYLSLLKGKIKFRGSICYIGYYSFFFFLMGDFFLTLCLPAIWAVLCGKHCIALYKVLDPVPFVPVLWNSIMCLWWENPLENLCVNLVLGNLL